MMASPGLTKVASAAKAANKACLSTTASCSAGSRQGRREPRLELSGAASLAALKKGPGYRSSFSGHVATVFGSTGCVGRAVCNRLGKNGTQMILPYRGDHYNMMRLKVCGDLGQVLFTPYHLKDEESIRRSLTHSDVAINLVGSAVETKNFSYRDVNVEGPARLARIAREMGVERFFHVSHVNARENPSKVFLPQGSEWLRTKWQGEQRVLEEFPDATIIRATDVYGKGDNFVHTLLRFWRRGYNGRMPLWAKGESTIKAPVYFGDIGLAIANAIDMPQSKGVTYEAYGPGRYLMSDLVDWMYLLCHRDPHYWHYKRTDLRLDPLVFTKAFVISKLPIGQKMLGKLSLDLLEREALSDDILGLPNLASLGVDASPVTEKMPFEVQPYLSFAYAEPTFSEEPPIPDPVPLSRMEIKEMAAGERSKGLLGHIGLTPT